MNVALAAIGAGDGGNAKGGVRRVRSGLRLPYPRPQSGSEKTTPLSESGSAVQLEVLSAGEGALHVEKVMNRGMDSDEFL
jgi:hypothetical protein